jgi:hypothetical protein
MNQNLKTGTTVKVTHLEGQIEVGVVEWVAGEKVTVRFGDNGTGNADNFYAVHVSQVEVIDSAVI